MITIVSRDHWATVDPEAEFDHGIVFKAKFGLRVHCGLVPVPSLGKGGGLGVGCRYCHRKRIDELNLTHKDKRSTCRVRRRPDKNGPRPQLGNRGWVE